MGGLALLVGGASWLVNGASRFAAAAGVAPLVIGLTVVAYGTSAPELAVSVQAAFAGSAGVALGNVVGSNIFNVLVVLGLSALIAPLAVDRDLLRRDIGVMIAVSAALMALAADGNVGRLDGLGLAAAGVLYTAWLARSARTGDEPAAEPASLFPNRGLARAGAQLVGGFAALILGAAWLVDSATAWAQALGVSDLIIGLTVVAAGTSLPEVAASAAAALRGERDLALGNVVGSNIFNILFVLGLAAALSPDGVDVSVGARRHDLPIMLATAVVCLPIAFTKTQIDRWEGGLLLGGYLSYSVWLFLSATEHEAAGLYSDWMVWIVIPLTGLMLFGLAFQQWRRGSSAKG